mmetsp:Transcript_88667/g.271460  ORF Transcript_88667/g.271460 Transcript_88667/m.271460 type:complete len:361 (-) Transcript_88667:747-1829(-)
MALGSDLVHAPRELRDGPVQGHGVALGDALFVHVLREDPVVRAIRSLVGDAVPAARQEVREHEDEDDQAYDVEDHDDLLRPQALREEHEDLPHAGDAEQPEHADDAERARGLAHSGHAQSVVDRQHQLDPVGGQDEDIQHEPREDVSGHDFFQAQLEEAVDRDVAGDEHQGHVQAPENPRRPRQGVGDRRPRQIEELHRDVACVEEDEEQAHRVPDAALEVVGVDDEPRGRADVVRGVRLVLLNRHRPLGLELDLAVRAAARPRVLERPVPELVYSFGLLPLPAPQDLEVRRRPVVHFDAVERVPLRPLQVLRRLMRGIRGRLRQLDRLIGPLAQHLVDGDAGQGVRRFQHRRRRRRRQL